MSSEFLPWPMFGFWNGRFQFWSFFPSSSLEFPIVLLIFLLTFSRFNFHCHQSCFVTYHFFALSLLGSTHFFWHNERYKTWEIRPGASVPQVQILYLTKNFEFTAASGLLYRVTSRTRWQHYRISTRYWGSSETAPRGWCGLLNLIVKRGTYFIAAFLFFIYIQLIIQ